MHKKTILIILSGLVAVFAAYVIGRHQAVLKTDDSPSPSQSSTPLTSAEDVKSLVSYSLPKGWKEYRCTGASGPVYIAPDGKGDCNNDKTIPLVVSIDAANNTDCNQLQDVSNVRKHTCISVYINGHKSLKSETIYNQQSSYKTDTTVLAYYINAGKEVIKVAYTYTTDNTYQAGWEDLAKSVNTK